MGKWESSKGVEGDWLSAKGLDEMVRIPERK